MIGDGGLAEAVEAARVGAEAENFARELQDLPSNVVTPSYLAGRAKAIAEEHDVRHAARCSAASRSRRREWAAWLPSPRAPPRSRS